MRACVRACVRVFMALRAYMCTARVPVSDTSLSLFVPSMSHVCHVYFSYLSWFRSSRSAAVPCPVNIASPSMSASSPSTCFKIAP